MAADPGKTKRIKMPVGELGDVNVFRISLVDRGANRVPFRMTKRDGSSEGGNQVLDFGKYFARKDEEAKPTEVAAIAVSAEADLDQAKAAIEGVGFSTEHLTENEDGHRLFIQGEPDSFDPDHCQFVKFADGHAGVFVRGAEEIQKAASQDFGENLGAQQFIPGLFMSMDALTRTVETVLDEAKDRDEAVSAIKGAASKFGAFVGTLAEQIPADVFKLEKAFDASQFDKDKKDKDAKAKGKAKKDEGEEKPEADAKADEKTDAKKGEAADEKPDTSEEGEAKVEKDEPEQDGKDPILKAIEGLGDQIATLAGQVAEAKETASEAKVLAEKADATSTAVGGQAPGDQAPELRFSRGRQVEKSEGGPPLMDTAFGGQS